MPIRPGVFRPVSVRGRQQTARDHDRQRARDPGRAARKRFYDCAAWQRTRTRKLAENPECEDCLELNLIEPAREVDHVEPLALAWGKRLEWSNLRSLCTPCHSRKTARERAGEGR